MTDRPFERAAAPWLILLISALVIFTLMPNNRSSILVKEMAYALGGAACSLLLASAAIRRVPLNPSVDWKLASAFVLLLAWMVSRHFSGVPSVNGPNVIISLGMLGLTAGSAGLLLDAPGRRTVLAGMVVLIGLLCVYSLLQWMNVVIFPWDVFLGVGGRVSGSLGNPNLLGGLLSAFIPVAAGFLLAPGAGHRMQRLVLLAAFTLASVLCIAASGTRGSIIGLGAGLAFMALFSLARSHGGFRGNPAILLICVASLLIVGFLMKDRLVELTRLGEGTARVRLVIWEGAARLIAANPFLGYGPGTFQIIFPDVRNPMYSLMGTSHNTLHVHCEYLEILVEVGLIGAMLYAATAWRIFRSSSSDGTGGRRRFDIVDAGIVGGIVALLAEAFVSVSLRWPPGAFLLAILCGLLLSGGGGSPRPVPRILGLVLIAPALFMAVWGTGRYVTGIRSGNYLFLGKDQYLDKIESEISLASNAAMAYNQTGSETRRAEALQRFESAWIYSDSSIAICTRCVETNPEELGGWYGLGSAWLTRAILIEPTNHTLAALLESESRPGVGDHELALQATWQALAAYESLRVRAPDYAELNNNLALTYTKLGLPDMAMSAMRRAYELHGHRRPDYLDQVFSLSPLGGQFDALHIIWLDRMNDLAMSIESGDKTEARLATAEWTSGLAILFNPGAADSLAEALAGMTADLPGGYSDTLRADLADQAALAAVDAELFRRAMECDTTGLLEAAAPGLASTDAILPGHLSARAVTLGLRGDMQGYDQQLVIADQLMYCGFEWISRWPSNGGIPAQMIAALTRTGIPASWRGVFLRMVLHLMNVDSFLANRIQISGTDFSRSVPPEVQGGLMRVWRGVGGLRASSDLDPSRAEPWIPGSVMAEAAALAGLPDTSNTGLLETGIAFNMLSMSSIWWNTTQPTILQRNYMTARLDALRDSLDSVLGVEEARYSMNRLMQEIEPTLDASFGGAPNPFVDLLEDDLIEGTPLSAL